MRNCVKLVTAYVRGRGHILLSAGVLAVFLAACGGAAEHEASADTGFDVARVPGTNSAPQSLAETARTAAEVGDYAAAVRLYREAYRRSDQDVAILIALGKTLAAMGAHDEAVETYRTAISLAPEAEGAAQARKGAPAQPVAARTQQLHARLDAMQGLGNALIALDRPTQAISQFEAILNLQERASAYNGLGVAHDMIGDHQVAQAYYRTGLQISPRNLGLLNNLGLSLVVTGSHDEAIEILRRAAVDPRAASRQRLNLALAYGLAGRLEEAAEIARIDLDEASVRSNLAYYRTLRALNDRKAMVNALGIHSRGFESRPEAGRAPPLPSGSRPRDAGFGGAAPLPGAAPRRSPFLPQATR